MQRVQIVKKILARYANSSCCEALQTAAQGHKNFHKKARDNFSQAKQHKKYRRKTGTEHTHDKHTQTRYHTHSRKIGMEEADGGLRFQRALFRAAKTRVR